MSEPSRWPSRRRRGARLVSQLAWLPIMAATLSVSAQAETLVVGIYDNSPKVYRDASGRPAGLFVELLEAIARREDWTLRYVDCDWNDCLAALQAGDIDLMPDVAYSEARRQRFDFHRIAVAHSWSTLLVPRESALNSLPDFANARFAVLRGAVQETAVARMMEGSALPYSVLPVASLQEGLAAVAAGEATALVSNSFYAGRHAAAHGLRESAVVFNPAALFFATGKGRHAAVLASIDEQLLAWREDSDSVYFDAMRRSMAPLPPAAVLSPQQRMLLSMAIGLALSLLVISALLRWQVALRTRELTRSNTQLQHLLAGSPVVLYLLKVEGEQLQPSWVSSNIERVLAVPADPLPSAREWLEQVHEDDRERVRLAFASLRRHGQIVLEYRMLDRNGQLRYIRDEARWLAGQGRGPDEIVGSWIDLTLTREQEARLTYLAGHDNLTGLPNRAALNERLDQAIASNEDRHFALMLLNVDRLHRVNDGFGHDAGDALLGEIARRLKAELGRGRVVARLGSDEFAVLLSHYDETDEVVALASRLLTTIAQPWQFGPHQLTITASIGISLFPGDGQSPGDLLKSADTALSAAKALGCNGFQFATAQMNAQIQRWVAIEHQLRQALESGQFHLHYQPRASLRDGQLCGAEALLRWNSPELGPVSPADFIPVAEDVGLIGAIGEWTLRSACQQARDWLDQGLPPLRVAVNVSAHQLRNGELPAMVQRVLDEIGLPSSSLEIELTESVMLHDSDATLAQLAALSRIGVMISLDDFGTGYSSLGYLSRLSLDSLKIDQGFVRDLPGDAKSAAIANATIGLAHGLGIKVIAEGVETVEQLRYLRAADCDEMQGYLFSRPIPPEQLATLLRERAHLLLPTPERLRQD